MMSPHTPTVPWPAITPLSQEIEPPAFPTRALPGWLADYIEAEAIASQTPEDLPGMLALAALSTAEKLGAALVALVLLPPDRPPLELPAAAPPLEDDVPEEPDDAGDDEELSPLVLLDEELCATATPDKANSAAAVAALRSFRFSIGKSPSDEMERAAFCLDARDVPFHPVSALALSTFPLHPLLAGDLTFAR